MSEDLLSNLVGNSQAMQRVKKLILQVAKTDATVIILGESGTGKEVVAQCLHSISSRSSKAFVPINCGAIPAELLESELFGHEKGAFTGAITARKGRFEMAESGTIFLDEIGDMPLPMQVKLLRVLQERIYERVGGNRSFTTDVRVIAATHRNLEDNITKGSFREDLFYRLNVFPIEVPSLKERVEDIPDLLEYILSKIKGMNRSIPKLSEKTIIALQHYDWPGNVRELANLTERLSILFPGLDVNYEDLPSKYQVNIPDGKKIERPDCASQALTDQDTEVSEKLNQDEGEVTNISITPQTSPNLTLNDSIDLKSYLIDVEIQIIQKALSQTSGNVSRAAKLLQTNRTTLVEKIRKFKLT